MLKETYINETDKSIKKKWMNRGKESRTDEAEVRREYFLLIYLQQ